MCSVYRKQLATKFYYTAGRKAFPTSPDACKAFAYFPSTIDALIFVAPAAFSALGAVATEIRSFLFLTVAYIYIHSVIELL